MASTIVTKNGSGAPLAGDLVQGELAVDLTNKRLYTENSGGTVIEVGVNPAAEIQANAGIALPDSQKATFGTSDDLQIYHDGSHSYISDTGTGDLFIKGDNNLWLRSAADENYIRCDTDGAVWLYYDNANKLATTSTGIDVTGEITADGIALGDSQKATFGAGNDLQIYHNGTTSVIADVGTGYLDIRGTDIYIQNSDASKVYISAINGGAVTLKHNNLDKLATTTTGIDVTGTVTADGLTVVGTTGLRDFNILDDSGTVVEASWSHVDGSGISTINVGRNSTWGGSLIIQTDTKNRANFASNGDISFYEDTGTTAKFFWDASAESLGIGTSSPATALDVTGTITADGLTVDGTNVVIDVGVQVSETPALEIRGNNNTANGNIIRFNDEDPTTGAGQAIGKIEWYSTDSAAVVADMSAYAVDASPDGAIKFRTASGTTLADRLVINNLGNVGIGTSSPSAPLHTFSTSADQLILETNTTNTGPNIAFKNLDGNLARIASAETNTLRFEIGPSNTEAMRIDSSGNVGIGTASNPVLSTGGATVGTWITPADYMTVASEGTCLQLNRQSTDGDIVRLRKDGTTVGSISVTTSATAYNTSSDYRLKENVVAMADASSRVLALNPVRFNFIADPNKTVDGFLAHEAQEVVPEAVHGTKDAMRTEEYEVSPAVPAEYDEEGNVITEAVEAVMGTREVPEYQGIDQSKLVPLLTKALQEALTEIESLKARLDAGGL